MCLLCVSVGFFPISLQSAPFLHNVNVTSGGENSVSFLTANLNNGGGGLMTLRVNWGDGTPLETFSYPATSPAISNHFHYYEDDNPTGTAGDVYTLSLTVLNSAGTFSTNIAVVVTNVPPRLSLNVHSPIEVGAPATLRGLEITEFPLPLRGSYPHGITAGPDGNLWFTEPGLNRVGKITTNGVITEYAAGGVNLGITSGSDGRLWFCTLRSSQNDGQIGAITTNGVVTMYTIPRGENEPPKQPQYLTRGGGEEIWYSDFAYRVGQITPSGVIAQRAFIDGTNPWGIARTDDNSIWFTDYFNDQVVRYRPSDDTTNGFYLDPLASPTLMTRGPDGAVWFTQFQAGKIGRITTNGVLTEAFVARSLPYGITTGPDGAIWFTERRSNSVARLTTDGHFSRYDLSIFSDPIEIVTGPDDALWFTMAGRDRIGRIRYTTAGNVVLSGNLNDPGYLDPHTIQIDWGDGNPVQTLNLAPGIASFHVAHIYSGSQPSYTINVTATDDDTGRSSAIATVLVKIRFTSITRSASGEVRLRGVGGNGRTVTIETSTDLRDWSGIGTANSVNNMFEFVHPAASGASRFYRGKLP
jgi:virginiamycin B lyase